jgi:hypothetical protein
VHVGTSAGAGTGAGAGAGVSIEAIYEYLNRDGSIQSSSYSAS